MGAVLIANKLGNYYGYYYDSTIKINLETVLQFIFSGQILIALIFGVIGYLILDHMISFWAYVFSRLWNQSIYDYQQHLNSLVDFSIIEINNGTIKKGEKFIFYQDIMSNLTMITRVAKNIISLIIFFCIAIILYRIGGKILYISCAVFSLNVFCNLIFITVKMTELKFHYKRLISEIEP